MLAPPDSSDRPGYVGPNFLKSSEMMVFELEDHDSVPEIWAVYPYGALSNYPTFPEAVVSSEGNTVAPDTKTGVAYWLLKHFNTFPRVTLLSTSGVRTDTHIAAHGSTHATAYVFNRKNGTARRTLRFVISNGFAPGISISPVFRAILRDGVGWNIQFKSRGKNVTNSVVRDGGLNFVGGLRISNNNPCTLEMSIQPKSKHSRPVTIQLLTMSNIANTVNQEISFTITAIDK